MQTLIKLDTVKQALRIDFDEDDELLQKLIAISISRVCSDTQRPVCELMHHGKLFEDIEMAIIALVGHYYNNPEATTNQSLQSVDLSYNAIIRPYKKLV